MRLETKPGSQTHSIFQKQQEAIRERYGVKAKHDGTETIMNHWQWINPAVFAVPAIGQWGDADRNIARAPGTLVNK